MILSELCVAGIQLHSNIKNEQIAASPTHEEQCQVLHLTKLREEEEEELKQQLQTSNSTSAFQKMVWWIAGDPISKTFKSSEAPSKMAY